MTNQNPQDGEVNVRNSSAAKAAENFRRFNEALKRATEAFRKFAKAFGEDGGSRGADAP